MSLFSPLFISLVLLLSKSTLSHNYLTNPEPYNTVWRSDSCSGSECISACNMKWSSATNSPEKPAAVYSRGQTVSVKWARNNHRGGFFRIALVPVEQMWDRPWHTRLTLLHGCWESGKYTCAPAENCGTDKSNLAFKRDVTIPKCFPDGNYVLGYVWYGGLEFTGNFGQFSDFYSCSHVRIQGGGDVGGVYKPFFEAGLGERIENGMCHTSSDAIGDCRTGCDYKPSFKAIPRVFRQGGLPSITKQVVEMAMQDGKVPVPGGEVSAPIIVESNDDVEEEEEDDDEEEEEVEEEEEEEESDKEDDDDEGDGEVLIDRDSGSGEKPDSGKSTGGGKGTSRIDRGICMGSVCCMSKCKKCGGSGCNRRDGGADGCCYSIITRSGIRCSDSVGAPCIRR